MRVLKRQPYKKITAALLAFVLLLIPLHVQAKPVDESKLSAYLYKSREAYVEMIKPIARKVGLKYHYLPSVLAAQCIQETGYGGYYDKNTASMIRYHNHLGMKTDMLNSTWLSHTAWKGKSYIKRTPEWILGGKLKIYINDSFRIYNTVEQCLIDYVMFMSWARLENGSYKYRNDVIGNPNYKKTIRAVMVNGYCTDPAYAKSVIRIIKQWHLTDLDDGFEVKVSKVKLNRSSTLKLKKGDSYKLKASVIPTNAANPRIRWMSSDPDIVSVNSKGKLKAKKKGKAYIYAISRENSQKQAKLKVVVK